MNRIQSAGRWTIGLLLCAAASTSLAATKIDTSTSWNGTDVIFEFGVPDTQTYGQVVTVPAGETSLTAFRFLINDEGVAFPFLGEVYAWDSINNHATGPALYESGTVTTSASGTFQNFFFDIPGGVPVVAGQQYVVFVSTSKSAQIPAASGFASVPDSVYPGGTFVYINNGNNPAQWTTVGWTTSFGVDTAFAVGFGGASIAAVQVPMLDKSTMLLLAAALALIGLVVLRLRQ